VDLVRTRFKHRSRWPMTSETSRDRDCISSRSSSGVFSFEVCGNCGKNQPPSTSIFIDWSYRSRACRLISPSIPMDLPKLPKHARTFDSYPNLRSAPELYRDVTTPNLASVCL